MLLLFGWGALIWQPIALTFGRRGALLFSLLATVVSRRPPNQSRRGKSDLLTSKGYLCLDGTRPRVCILGIHTSAPGPRRRSDRGCT